MIARRRRLLRVLAGALLLAAPRPLGAHAPGTRGPARPPAPGTAPRPADSANDGVTSPLARNPSLAVIREAPDFTLLDPDGRSRQLSALRGRVVLIAFVYTSCPAACPLITQRMAVLQGRLREARLLPARAALVSITVDPARDRADVLARYARAFRADPGGWWFLREEPERLRPVLTAYDEWTRPVALGEIDHPARLHLIDPRGRVREIYSLALFDERQALLDIQALLRE